MSRQTACASRSARSRSRTAPAPSTPHLALRATLSDRVIRPQTPAPRPGSGARETASAAACRRPTRGPTPFMTRGALRHPARISAPPMRFPAFRNRAPANGSLVQEFPAFLIYRSDKVELSLSTSHPHLAPSTLHLASGRSTPVTIELIPEVRVRPDSPLQFGSEE